jgi:thiamine-phosphate pyrophosphorylase
MHHFKLILISDEQFSEKEIPLIQWAFKNGLDRFHLRKQNASQEEINRLLSYFSAEELAKITIHYHHQLPYTVLPIIGLHYSLDYLRKSCSQEEILTMENIGSSLSFSLHQWNEIQLIPDTCDYVFMSPIYPSISKPGYQNSSLLNEMVINPDNSSIELIGLGGIRPEHLQALNHKGFNGAAILGAVWKGSDPKVALESFFQSRIALK